MRFMIIRRADAETEAGAMPSEQLIADMARYMDEMAQAGILLGGDGLKPPSQGAMVRFRRGTPTVTDGPFTEAKDLVGGFTLVEARDIDQAVELSRGCPILDGGGSGEVRPVMEMGM